jgi:hypothetical protein
MRIIGDRQAAAREIESVFSDLRQNLAAREKELLGRLKTISERKKSAMMSHIEQAREVTSSCRLLRETSVGYQDVCGAAAAEDDAHAGLYIVSVAHTIQRRAAEIKSEFSVIPSSPQVHPRVRAHFRPAEARSINRLVQSIGSIDAEDIPPYKASDEDADGTAAVSGEELILERLKNAPSVAKIPLKVALRLSSG